MSQLSAGGDLQLWEDVVQVKSNRSGRQKQRGADLAIGQAARRQLRDLALLRS
jgi:hypothetical protein